MAAKLQDLSGYEAGEQLWIRQMTRTETETRFPDHSDLLWDAVVCCALLLIGRRRLLPNRLQSWIGDWPGSCLVVSSSLRRDAVGCCGIPNDLTACFRATNLFENRCLGRPSTFLGATFANEWAPFQSLSVS